MEAEMKDAGSKRQWTTMEVRVSPPDGVTIDDLGRLMLHGQALPVGTWIDSVHWVKPRTLDNELPPVGEPSSL